MLRPLFALPLALAALPVSLSAQWTESGDAGNLPNGAQVPDGFTISALSAIDGTITTGDVDMYVIRIPDPAAFSATTVGGTTNFDTQLFLFHEDGRGVAHNDDTPGGGTLQSTITGLNVPHPGVYLIAVAPYNIDPIASGQTIWENSPFTQDRAPDGARRLEALTGWGGIGNSTGTYTITFTGCNLVSTRVTCPDTHYLSGSPAGLKSSGSTSWWREGGGRFQVLYEASHFTNVGTVGSFFIDRLMFRGEDGNPDLGGQVWNNVAVTIAQTTLDNATLSNDFALNLDPSTTVTSESTTFGTVTVAPSIGSYPNNYNIQLDLFGTIFGFEYDPSGGNSLLIDITMPTAATLPAAGNGVMPIQDAAGTVAVVRGRGLNSSNPTATTGTLSLAPPVIQCHIDNDPFNGGFAQALPASNEHYGHACGGAPASFYELFLRGQPIDLTGFTLTPDNAATPNYYIVTPGAPAFDAAQVNATPDSTSDTATLNFNMGFAFAYPGGSTADIRPTTDGCVYLSSTLGASDFSVTVGEFLGSTSNEPATLAPLWYDWHAGRNTAINPNAGLHVLTTGVTPNRVCYITWYNVGIFEGVATAGTAVHDMQVAIYETSNVVEFRYGSMPAYAENFSGTTGSVAGIAGFSRGTIGGTTASVDPQSRDLSVEIPFSTSVEGSFGNIGQLVRATPDAGGQPYGARAYAGQTLTFDAVNIPPTAVIGVQLIDFTAVRPGFNFPGVHPADCAQGVTAGAVLFELHVLPSPSISGTAPLVIPPGFEGADLYAQYALLDGLVGAPTLVTALSNAVRFRIGTN